MKYLFIDSATANLVVAIIINDEIKYLYNQVAGKDMSSVLMPKIEEAFKKVRIKPQELDKIFIVNGPGSFTGIRVGLTVAKTMAWSLKIPIIPISSLEAIASENGGLGLIDARRGYVFAGGYDENLNNIFEDQYILLDKINLDIKHISYDDITPNKPNIDILKVINKHKHDIPVNPHTLKPNYLKLTEAEEKLNKND